MATPATTPNASNKPTTPAHTKATRLPAPTLFVGPPSRNASLLSISRQPPAESRTPLARPANKSSFSRPAESTSSSQSNDDSVGPAPVAPSSSRGVEAKWREMQATLNEVELTAQSSTHVFGESHARALDELRSAQVELARAWGRGNQDEADPGEVVAREGGAAGEEAPQMHRFQGADEIARDRAGVYGRKGRVRADTGASAASTALSDESGGEEQGTGRGGKGVERSPLVDETAQDIKLASERRAVNEAYFKKVDRGVRDVVARLEVVAEAMRGVEGESRSLWSTSTSSVGDVSESEKEKSGSGSGSGAGSDRNDGRSRKENIAR